MENALKDQIVIVFGATGRAGADVSRFLARQGATVIVQYNSNHNAADRVVADIVNNGGNACPICVDVLKPEEVQLCYKSVVQKYGRIDAVVNLIHKGQEFEPVNIADMEWKHWEDHIDSMKAHFNICKHIIPYMREQHYGRIVFVSGGLAFRFFDGVSPFSAAKAGLNAFSKSLAREEGHNNITVNIVAPGKIVRPGDSLTAVSGNWEETERKELEGIPLGRFCTPEDVGNAIMCFLLPSSGFITGQTVYLAGGEIMPMP